MLKGPNPNLEDPRDQAILGLLRAHGYNDWETYMLVESHEVFHRHQVIAAKKEISWPGYDPFILTFSWEWDNDGGPEYWIGTLKVYFNPAPEYKWRCCVFDFSIRTIMDNTIHLLPWFEQCLLNALIIQRTFKEDGLEIKDKEPMPRLPQ